MEIDLGGEEDAPAPIRDASRSSSSSSASSSSSSSISSSSSTSPKRPARRMELDAGLASVEYEIPRSILGVKVHVDTHYQKGTKGLRVMCPHKEGCNCYRSLHLWYRDFGASSAAKYLECWLSHARTMKVEVHRSWRPSKRDVRMYLDSLP